MSVGVNRIKQKRSLFGAVAVAVIMQSVLFVGGAHASEGVSPLSGLPGGEGKPVVMVKYGNARPDRPHYGLQLADLVYVEEVEWGLTRIAAMFNSRFPAVVGPTRSARISDLEILEQFTKPGLVYSGANDVLLKAVRKSNAVSLSPSDRSSFYYRNLSKEMPHNQLARLAAMMEKETKVAPVGDVGFTFDRVVPEGGTKVKSFQVSWPSARVSGVATNNGWTISMDGTVQRDAQNKSILTPKTIIIQFVEQKESAYGDRFGGKTPLVKTIGSGRAIVLRNGRSFESVWSRPTGESGTSFTFNDAPLAFDVGQVFVLLIDRKTKKGNVVVK